MNLIVQLDELELEAFAEIDRESGYCIEGLTIVLNHPTKMIKQLNGTTIPLTLDITEFLNKRQLAEIKEQLVDELEREIDFRKEENERGEK